LSICPFVHWSVWGWFHVRHFVAPGRGDGESGPGRSGRQWSPMVNPPHPLCGELRSRVANIGEMPIVHITVAHQGERERNESETGLRQNARGWNRQMTGRTGTGPPHTPRTRRPCRPGPRTLPRDHQFTAFHSCTLTTPITLAPCSPMTRGQRNSATYASGACTRPRTLPRDHQFTPFHSCPFTTPITLAPCSPMTRGQRNSAPYASGAGTCREHSLRSEDRRGGKE
jgi:hypothetical protein